MLLSSFYMDSMLMLTQIILFIILVGRIAIVLIYGRFYWFIVLAMGGELGGFFDDDGAKSVDRQNALETSFNYIQFA